MAVPVDPVRATIKGEPTMVVDGILQYPGRTVIAQVTVAAADGTLAYLPSRPERLRCRGSSGSRRKERSRRQSKTGSISVFLTCRGRPKGGFEYRRGSEGNKVIWVYDLIGRNRSSALDTEWLQLGPRLDAGRQKHRVRLCADVRGRRGYILDPGRGRHARAVAGAARPAIPSGVRAPGGAALCRNPAFEGLGHILCWR